MNRIIAAVENVIALCIRKAGVPLLWCLVLYLIGMGALSSGQNASFLSIILTELRTIASALWYLVQYWILRVAMPPTASFGDIVSFDHGDWSWAITIARIVAVWAMFLLLIAFALATFVRILGFLWGGIPRPFFPWLWRLCFPKSGRFASRRDVDAIKPRDPPRR